MNTNLTTAHKRTLARWHGKVIDNEEFHINGVVYKCQIRMKKNNENKYRYTAIYAWVEVGDDGDVHADPNTVTGDSLGDPAPALEALKENIAREFSVEWKDFIRIVVASGSSGHSRQLIEGALHISIGRLQIGTRQNGDKCWRSMALRRDEWSPSGIVRSGEPPLVPRSSWGGRRNESIGVIPYDDAQWLKLTEIMAGLEELRSRVSDAITGDPKEIATRLQDFSQLQLTGGDE